MYDAWKFVKDSFRRAFLLHLIDELKLKKEPYVEKLYTNKSEEQETKLTYNSKKFWFFIVLPWGLWLVLTIIGFCYFYEDSVIVSALCNSFVIPFALNLIYSFRFVFDELKTTKQTHALFSAEQFTECFSDILKKSLKNTNPIKRFRNWVCGTPRLDKLIIVIDNIDRCNPETTYELLSTIKTFLVNHNDLILIIPVDEGALCEHLQKRFDNRPDRSKEFLRKIFNLEVRIKPLETVELYGFASKINQTYNLGFSPDAIDIISKEYASNPRRIIQFFNNARTEWDIIVQRIKEFSEQDIELAKNAMCKLLIIREEWPFYYEQIRKAPEKLLVGQYNTKTSDKNIDALNVFLKSTEFYPLLRDESKLNKIISNNTMFDDLPIQTLTDLKSLDIKQVANFVEKSDDNQSKIIKYIEKELTNSLRRDITGTSASLFKFILQLNGVVEGISNPNNIRLKNVLKGHICPIISTMLDKTPVEDFVDDLTCYINTLIQSGQTYLFTEIMNDCILPTIKLPNNSDEYEPTNTDWLYAQLIKGIVDKTLFNKYKESFCAWKLYIPDDLIDINDITKSDLQHFITDDFQEQLINRMSLANDNETTNLKTVTYLLSSYKQSSALIKKVFNQLNQIYPNYAVGQKSRSVKLLNSILPALQNTKPQNFVSEIASLILKLLSYRQYGYNIASNETYADKDECIKMMELLCKILNFTLDKNISHNVSNELNNTLMSYLKILVTRTTDLQSDLLALIKTHVTNPNAAKWRLADLIFGKKTYNEDYCYIVKHIVTWHFIETDKTSPDYWCIKDDLLAKELQNLLLEFKTIESTRKILLTDLITYLTDERKNCVRHVMQTLNDSAIIDNLPDIAKKIALQHIYENLEAYESDTHMLKLIAQNADAEIIKDLVENVILKKMIAPDTKAIALDVFECIPKTKASKYRQKINALK
ncbi:MAG: hypothetical protein KBT14_02105 [Proteobacteria bacterium]|nr:hypothetical protein [Candidatus Enterousia onthequi]